MIVPKFGINTIHGDVDDKLYDRSHIPSLYMYKEWIEPPPDSKLSAIWDCDMTIWGTAQGSYISVVKDHVEDQSPVISEFFPRTRQK